MMPLSLSLCVSHPKCVCLVQAFEISVHFQSKWLSGVRATWGERMAGPFSDIFCQETQIWGIDETSVSRSMDRWDNDLWMCWMEWNLMIVVVSAPPHIGNKCLQMVPNTAARIQNQDIFIAFLPGQTCFWWRWLNSELKLDSAEPLKSLSLFHI